MPPRPAAGIRRKAVAANASNEPLPKLRQLGSRVLQAGNNAVFTQQELSAAEDELVIWVKKKEEDAGSKPSVWAAVGLEGLPALHGLYALALRRSCVALEPGVSDTMRAAFASLRSKLGLELVELLDDCGTRATLDFLGKIGFATLRSQTLRCHAVLLAEVAARLAPPAGLQEPQSSLPQQPPRRPRRVMQAASDALTEARQVLDMLRALLSLWKAKDSDDLAFDVWGMIKEFASELEASGLLEHWSRLLLLLAACEGWEDKAAEHLHALGNSLSGMEKHLSFTSRWNRTLLLASPCLSYLLSSHVVGLCAALDGGPTYGMPAVQAAEEGEAGGGEGTAAMAAPVFGATGLRLRQRGSAEGAGTALTLWALSAWGDIIKSKREDMQNIISAARRAAGQGEQSQPGPACLPATMSLKALRRRACDILLLAGLDPALDAPLTLGQMCGTLIAVPPLHTAAVFELCMRLVAAVTATAAQGAAPTRGLGTAPRVAESEAPQLAKRALMCSHEALGADVRTAAALGPATTARLRRWWAALVAVMDVAERHVGAEGTQWRGMVSGSLMDPPAVVARPGIPDRPSPCVAAALDAGYLPRFARVLRRIPTASKYWEITTGQLPDGAHIAWEQMLAFAPPRETAALLRSIAALVQRAANAVPSGEATAHGPVKKSGINDPDAHNLRTALRAASHVYQDALLGLVSPPGAVAEAATLTEPTFKDLAAMAGGGGAPEHAAVGQPRVAGEGGDQCVAAPAPAAMPRLGLALSCAASQLLPHVSQTLLCRHLAFATGCEWSSCRFVKPMLAQLLTWAVLVAAALKRARDQEAAAAAAAATDTSDAAGTADAAAGPSSPEAGSAAAEWRELLVTSLRLPALLGTVLGVIKAASKREGTEALAASFQWAVPALLHLAPLETVTAWSSEEAKAAEAAAEAVAAHYQQTPPPGVAGSGPSLGVEVKESAAGAANDLPAQDADAEAPITQDELLERANRSVGSVPGLEALLERAAFLVPPSQLEAVLG